MKTYSKQFRRLFGAQRNPTAEKKPVGVETKNTCEEIRREKRHQTVAKLRQQVWKISCVSISGGRGLGWGTLQSFSCCSMSQTGIGTTKLGGDHTSVPGRRAASFLCPPVALTPTMADSSSSPATDFVSLFSKLLQRSCVCVFLCVCAIFSLCCRVSLFCVCVCVRVFLCITMFFHRVVVSLCKICVPSHTRIRTHMYTLCVCVYVCSSTSIQRLCVHGMSFVAVSPTLCICAHACMLDTHTHTHTHTLSLSLCLCARLCLHICTYLIVWKCGSVADSLLVWVCECATQAPQLLQCDCHRQGWL